MKTLLGLTVAGCILLIGVSLYFLLNNRILAAAVTGLVLINVATLGALTSMATNNQGRQYPEAEEKTEQLIQMMAYFHF